MEEAANLIDSIANLLSIFIWPVILLFILVRFRKPLADFVKDISELTFKGGGVETSIKRRQAQVAASLGAAAIMHPDKSGGMPTSGSKTTAELVSATITPRLIRHAEKAALLWVDDRPANNIHERQAFEAIGINVILATSTEEALEKVSKRNFNVIISDMGRPPDSRAGYSLLDTLREKGDQTPYIIFAGSRDPEHRAESRRRGAMGCTNRPDELFDMVLSAIGPGE